MNILTVIPARAGSKGIPRKNVRMLHGQPLISYAVQNALASQYDMDVAISTDDVEVARIGKRYGAFIIDREPHLAGDDVTLDPVIYDAYMKMEELQNKTYDLVITLQATSPLLKATSLDEAITQLLADDTIDTMLSGVNNPHLSWTTDEVGAMIPAYEARLNRQYLPSHFMETGAFFITRSRVMSENSRIGENVSVYEVSSTQSIDIDTAHDWWLAENELSKQNILIRVEGYDQIGLGHVYRALSLAYGLIHHNIHFVLSRQSDLGINKIEASHFKYTVIDTDEDMLAVIKEQDADIVINDMLNTTIKYISMLRQQDVHIVNFEDLGDGGELADAVINDLYAPLNNENHYFWGSDYFILRDEFLISEASSFNERVQNILVIFGGVDPSGLTEKLLNTIPYLNEVEKIKFTIIVGPGYRQYEELQIAAADLPYNIEILRDVKTMSDYMSKADIAISSQGRTMLELASMSVPTILMAQNKRELTHEFGDLANGFINLGLGSELSEQSVAATLNWLIETPQIRQQMYNQMAEKDLKNGLEHVLKIIFG